MNDAVPAGWVETTLGEICSKPQYGWTSKASRAGKVKYLRTTDISRGKINWEDVPYCQKLPPDLSKYQVEIDDILVSRAGSVGLSYHVDEEAPPAAFASYLIRFTPLPGISPDYIGHYLKSAFYWQFISEMSAGIAVPNVNATKLAELPIPLAPLPEQSRIVAKLEKLLSKVEASQKRLERIPLILKRFRQSVLAAACSGKLTEDWRKENGLEEKTDTKSIHDVADYLGGFAYRSPTFLEKGHHQVIRIGNVKSFALELDSSPVFIPEAIARETEKFRLLTGDIVVSMTGTKYKRDYGNAAIVEESERKLYLNQRVARLRPTPSVLPKFLLFWLQTDLFRDYFFAGETGNVNQGNVGADAIRMAPIELPRLDEQQEILRRVEAMFSLADKIESRYEKAKAQVDKLAQSILAKAFRGELVPQDPNDEPASVLLERVKSDNNRQER